MVRTHYLRKGNGKFAGSIGTGKTVIPTAASARKLVVTKADRIAELAKKSNWYQTPSNLEFLVAAQDYYTSSGASRAERRNFRIASNAKTSLKRLKLASSIPALGEPGNFQDTENFDEEGKYEAIAWGLINNPRTEGDELSILTHSGKEVKGLNNLLAGNWFMSEGALLEIVNESDQIEESYKNWEEATTHGDEDPLYVLAQRFRLPLSVQQALAVKKDPKIRQLLSRNPSADPKFRRPSIPSIS